MSASTTPTYRPWVAMAAARLAVTEDLPTPPLPEVTAYTRVRLPGWVKGMTGSAHLHVGDALDLTDLATRVRGDRVLERAAGHGEQYADGHGARLADLDRFDHAEIGDRTAELGVDDSAQSLTNCVFGRCGHDAILGGTAHEPSWRAAR